MLKSSAKILSAFLFAACCAKILATGYYEPVTWLQDGGQAVLQAPEFFWEIECKRIAKEFVPVEKRVVAPPSNDSEADRIEGLNLHDFTAKKDIEEFTAAVKSGYVKSADGDAAIKVYTEAREIIQTTRPKSEPAVPDAAAKPAPAAAPIPAIALPAEPDGEFADYHKGALAFHAEDRAAAKAAWETLLKRPVAERKYRSTWAAFMLGKVAMEDEDNAGAVKYFQMTRQLAKEGFADSLGLAADSYGWEASAEESQGHNGKAARLYLTQLGAGDVSAVASLHSVIPGLPSTNADAPSPSGPAAEAAKTAQKELDEAAADPILRRLITANLLSSVEKDYPGDETKPDIDLHLRWLGMMEKVGVQDNTDAENLGWVAYMAGKYAEAARWLKLSTGKTPAAHWLKAKLALRKGNTADAAAALSEAVRGLQEQDKLENTLRDGPAQLPYESTRGDLGTVLLARGDFIQALDTFLQTELWLDAAYVAERCLTTKELSDYAAKHFSAEMLTAFDAKKDTLTEEESEAQRQCSRFRALVARRLVREDHYKEARAWFEAPMLPILDEYTTSLAKGNNEKSPKKARARDLFHAAWIARYQGMELMGTEAGPDNTADGGGRYGANDVAMERLTGKPHPIEDDDGNDPGNAVSPALPVSAAEKARLAATRLNPERRYHYRHVAAGLAWKAAALLPDGAEETVDVLNTAGTWIKDKHEKQADRFYQAIERRCSKTELGKEAVSKHWFVEQDGIWSAEESAADKVKEEAAAKKNQEESEKREAERAKAKAAEAK